MNMHHQNLLFTAANLPHLLPRGTLLLFLSTALLVEPTMYATTTTRDLHFTATGSQWSPESSGHTSYSHTLLSGGWDTSGRLGGVDCGILGC